MKNNPLFGGKKGADGEDPMAKLGDMFGGKNGKNPMDMIKNMFGGGKDGEENDGKGMDGLHDLFGGMGKGGQGMDEGNHDYADDNQAFDHFEPENDDVYNHGAGNDDLMGSKGSLDDLFANDPELAKLAREHGYDPTNMMKTGQGHRGEM